MEPGVGPMSDAEFDEWTEKRKRGRWAYIVEKQNLVLSFCLAYLRGPIILDPLLDFLFVDPADAPTISGPGIAARTSLMVPVMITVLLYGVFSWRHREKDYAETLERKRTLTKAAE